jgi:hypothetical protein
VTPFHKPTIKSLSMLKSVRWHIRTIQNDEKSHSISVEPWTEELIKHVALFSQYLLNDQKAKKSPELVALGYWCRKANLMLIHQDFICLENELKRESLGKVFHIAPANVDTVFFYSLILSALSGNQNIVRISERSGDLCRLLIHTFHQFLNQHQTSVLSKLISVVEYSSTHTEATRLFSQWSDLRVIWGGDSAIKAISLIDPNTKQLCFPDRFSIAAMQLTEIDISNIPQIATRFIADFLPFNQQACSSPKALFWLNTSSKLQQQFYCELKKALKVHQQQFGLSEQVERHINLQQILLFSNNTIIDKNLSAQLEQVQLQTIEAEHLQIHRGNGLLLTRSISNIKELPFHDKLQTISYYGFDLIHTKEIISSSYKRIITVGNALNFSHRWDGVNLLSHLSK